MWTSTIGDLINVVDVPENRKHSQIYYKCRRQSYGYTEDGSTPYGHTVDMSRRLVTEDCRILVLQQMATQQTVTQYNKQKTAYIPELG